MLVGTMTDEEILQELIKDYNNFKGDVLTKAKKTMLEERKNNRKGYSLSQYRFVSKRGNPWFVEVKYDRRTRKLVYINPMACMNANSYRIFVLKFNEYDGEIKAACFPAHCIKRIRERIKRDVSGMDNFELLNSIFMESEIAVGTAANKEDLASSLGANFDSEDRIYLTGIGYFVSKIGEPMYIFKTFLGDIVKNTRNRFLCDFLESNWIRHNEDILPDYYSSEDEWPYKETRNYRPKLNNGIFLLSIINLGPVRREQISNGSLLPYNDEDMMKKKIRDSALFMASLGYDYNTALALERQNYKKNKRVKLKS